MLIMVVILQIVSLLLVFVYFWAILLFHGRAKSNLLFHTHLPKQNIVQWRLLLKRSFGYDGYLKIREFLFLILLLCIVTTKVLFRLLITQFFMSERSTSRLTVILFVITSSMPPLLFLLFLVLCRLQISLPSRTPNHGFVCWLANSRCL